MDATQSATTLIDSLLSLDSLHDVLESWGAHVQHRDDRGAALAHLEDVSTQWDFRKGQERNLAGATALTTEQASAAFAVAEDLFMVGDTIAQKDTCSYLLVLGGLARACVSRPAYAARLVAHGLSVTSGILALAGFRPLNGDEGSIVDALAIAADDEFDVMAAGMQRAFNAPDPARVLRGERSDVVGASWEVAEFVGQSPATFVVAAPSTAPGERRATTADTYAFLAEDLVALTKHDHVVIVTSAIYRPYQHGEALRLLALPYGCSVETVGVETSALVPPLTLEPTPAQYLQELRSTIRSYRQLWAAVSKNSDHAH
jgi:hypothetical protein